MTFYNAAGGARRSIKPFETASNTIPHQTRPRDFGYRTFSVNRSPEDAAAIVKLPHLKNSAACERSPIRFRTF